MQTFWKILGAILLLFALLAVVCFKPIDKTPFAQTDFYKRQLQEIESIKYPKQNDSALYC
jgi:hypothetical protein